MCTNYTPTRRERLDLLGLGRFAVEPGDWPPETWPGYLAPLIVRGREPGDPLRLGLARFGLVPRWARDRAQADALSRHTYNARHETAASKPSFRSAWRERHFALAPMDDFFEPCWEDPSSPGRSVRWRVAAVDGGPLTAAALWERWIDPDTGEVLIGFSLLTCNADGHGIASHLHRPGEEKRMPVLIPPAQRKAWLEAAPEQTPAFMQALAAKALLAQAAPLRRKASGASGQAPP